MNPQSYQDQPPQPHKYQQKEVFPTQYNPATNVSNLEYANFTSSSLSTSLSETDPKRKMRFIDFIKEFHFVNYRMTRGEAEDVFKFADVNRDDLIETSEWDDLVGLFVLPFEACDNNKDYLLDENEFKVCFDRDPKSKSIVFNRIYKDIAHIKIMEVMTHRAQNLINFNEYLFIRRALFAWKNCHSNAKYMAKSHFSCALKTALGFERKISYRLSDDEIYEAGFRIDNDHQIQLNFINYLRILYYFNVFNIYSNGNSIGVLDKNQLLKTIKEDRLPNNIEESEVELWYDLISANPLRKETQMKFTTFALFYTWHRLFNKYSVERPLQISETEALNLFKDELAPSKIFLSVDKSYTHFSEKEYIEASLSLNRLRPNESKYFNSFMSLKEDIATLNTEFLNNSNEGQKTETTENEEEKEEAFLSNKLRELMVASLTNNMIKFKQDASENTAAIWNSTTINSTYYERDMKQENRKVLFSTFVEGSTHFWTKVEYFRAFSLGNLFTSLISDSRFIVPSTEFVDKLMAAYETSNPPTNTFQRKNYGLYKLLSRDISVDILTFFVIENYRHKLRAYMESYSQNVPETLMKVMLNDYGMENMPDPIIDLGKVGQNISKERIYNPQKTMENVVFVHSIASENARNAFMRNKSHMKESYETSRKFPGDARRQQASPFV